MKSLLLFGAASIAVIASATVYEAEIWLYRINFDTCAGPGTAEWLTAHPAQPLPLPSEEAVGTVCMDGIPIPLPNDLLAQTSAVTSQFGGGQGAPYAQGVWQWMPGASAHPGPPILFPYDREGVVTFLDTTPIQYLIPIDGERFQTATLDTSPGIRVLVNVVRANSDTLGIELTCEYSTIVERATVPGAEELAVGAPVWTSGTFTTTMAVAKNRWAGALIPVGATPIQHALVPVIKIRDLPATAANADAPTYFEYDIDGDGVLDQVPSYKRAEGAPLPQPERPVPAQPAAPNAPVPPEGYDTLELGQYAVESQVIKFHGTLNELPFAPCDAAWPLFGNAIAAACPDGMNPNDWIEDSSQRGIVSDAAPPELLSAPRATAPYTANASTVAPSTLFKIVAHSSSGGFGGGGPAGRTTTLHDILGTLADSDAFHVPGHTIVADMVSSGLEVPYDAHGWGPFKRSKRVARDSGVLASMWVAPTRDPDVLRVDYYFRSPYVVEYDTPPATQAEAEALIKAHEFHYLYECRDGQWVCFISSTAPDNHLLVFVQAKRVPWKIERISPAAVASGAGGGYGGGGYGGGGTVAPEAKSAPSSALQNIEVHGEIRVRASVRSR